MASQLPDGGGVTVAKYLINIVKTAPGKASVKINLKADDSNIHRLLDELERSKDMKVIGYEKA